MELICPVVLLVVILYLSLSLRKAHRDRHELYRRYMAALQQLTVSSMERFELAHRLEKYEPAPESVVQILTLELKHGPRH